eukprot:2587283-Rhodomonas_salina.2
MVEALSPAVLRPPSSLPPPLWHQQPIGLSSSAPLRSPLSSADAAVSSLQQQLVTEVEVLRDEKVPSPRSRCHPYVSGPNEANREGASQGTLQEVASPHRLLCGVHD